MNSGGTTATEPIHQPQVPLTRQTGPSSDHTWNEVRASLRNLRYGSVTIIVQDGVIIQIDRTEKRRLQGSQTSR